MSAQILLWVFLGSCLLVMGSALSQKDGPYEFSLVYGAAWVGYVLPQAYIAVRDRALRYDSRVIEGWSLEVALLVCSACVLAGWWGYQTGQKGPLLPRAKGRPPRAESVIAGSTLMKYGLALGALGLSGAILLASMMGGFRAQFSEGAHYRAEWTGLAVIYSYLANALYPGLLLCALAALSCRRLSYWLALAGLSIYPMFVVVYLGRRTVLVTLLLFAVFALKFARGIAVPRIAFGLGVLGMSAWIIIAPAVRTVTQYGLSGEQLSEVQAKELLRSYASGQSWYMEFDALVYRVKDRSDDWRFGLGTGFWNGIVRGLIPAYFFGQKTKQALMVDLYETDEGIVWELPYGGFSGGAASVYEEFGIAGAAVFWGIGRAMAGLRRRATESLAGAAAYISAVPLVLLGVVDSVETLLVRGVILVGLLGPLFAMQTSGGRGARRRLREGTK